MSATEVSKQQPAGGIEISQSDLLQAASSMGPSVSDSERRKYQAMYVLNILNCLLWAGGGSLRSRRKKQGNGGKARKGKEKPLPNPLFQISVSPTSYPSLLLLTLAKKARLVVIVSIGALVWLLPSRLLSLVSLLNRKAERRGWQNSWVWQTWWGY